MPAAGCWTAAACVPIQGAAGTPCAASASAAAAAARVVQPPCRRNGAAAAESRRSGDQAQPRCLLPPGSRQPWLRCPAAAPAAAVPAADARCWARCRWPWTAQPCSCRRRAGQHPSAWQPGLPLPACSLPGSGPLHPAAGPGRMSHGASVDRWPLKPLPAPTAWLMRGCSVRAGGVPCSDPSKCPRWRSAAAGKKNVASCSRQLGPAAQSHSCPSSIADATPAACHAPAGARPPTAAAAPRRQAAATGASPIRGAWPASHARQPGS